MVTLWRREGVITSYDSVNSTYQAIKANPGIPRKRISELTGKSISTIDRHIALMAKSNIIEHKVIVIRDGEMTYDNYQLQISKRELEINTIRLAQLVRCAIIYLCNFVMHAEYDKKERL